MSRIIIWTLILMVILAIGSVMMANRSVFESLAPGGNAQESQDQTFAAFQNLIARAKSGDAQAQFNVGRAYAEGRGVEASKPTAAGYFTKAANQGHANAQVRLGLMYYYGDGVRQDYYKAAKMFRLAASMGLNKDAQYMLAEMYRLGQGVQNDVSQAVKYYRLSAKRGHPGAQMFLGSMYEKGWGIKKDLVAAYVFYARAVPQAKNAKAYNKQYDPVASLARVKALMTRVQLAEAGKLLK